MWVCLYADTDNPPECYENWDRVRRWAEMTFGVKDLVKNEWWPMAFAPNWFYPDMVPGEPDRFVPVCDNDLVIGMIVQTDDYYPHAGGTANIKRSQITAIERENIDAQYYWQRRKSNWKRSSDE